MSSKANKFLFIILLLAAFLRFYKLGSIPPHLTPDEAALGYNAYSILKTGKDEYGQILPIVFKSFGDYKPGLYVYATIPFVAAFGLTEFSVRFASALAGVFAVLLFYLILDKFKNFSSQNDNLQLGLIAALFLAINPWHIHFSRGAWEANLCLTLSLVGIYFFLKALRNSKYLVSSSIFLGLTLWAYQGAKLSTLIIILVLTISFLQEIKQLLSSKREVLKAILVGLIIVLPVGFSFWQGKTTRLNIFSVFSYPRKEQELRSFLNQGGEDLYSLSYYLFHSESLNFLRGIAGRWFNHFSARFLFFGGDYQNPRHSTPNHGMLLFSDMLFLTLGLFYLFSVKNNLKLKIFTFSWLVLAPLPAVLSRDQVHAVRAINMVIPLSLISAFGVSFLLQLITREKGLKRSFSIESYRPKRFIILNTFVLITLFILDYIYFLDAYFVHLPIHNSKLWEYGYKQIVDVVTPIKENYRKVKIQQSFAQPYIYFLFYQKYDPSKYQKNARLIESEYKGDVGYVENLDNICFCAIDWPQNKKEHGTLVVADDIRIPASELESDSVNLIKEIKYLNSETAFRIVEVK